MVHPDPGGWNADNTCTDLFETIDAQFPGAGAIVDCADVPGGKTIAQSLLNLEGRLIDNEGNAVEPCVAVRCDGNYAYIATNNLPHYDFVPLPPNPLLERAKLHRIPIQPQPLFDATGGDNAATLNGCEDTYDQYLSLPGQATVQEPSGLCSQGRVVSYVYDDLPGGRQTYQRLPCLAAPEAVMIGGVVV